MIRQKKRQEDCKAYLEDAYVDSGYVFTYEDNTIVQTNDKLASSWSNILTAALLCFFIVLKSYLSVARRREYEESAEHGMAE